MNSSPKNTVCQKKEEMPAKLKVLCFHGYRQDAEGFKNKLGSFRKFVKKYADFTFVNAPHIVQETSANDEEQSDSNNSQRSWWFNKDDKTFKGTNKSGPALGFEESLRLVEKTWTEQGPFQGILGFSQGACLAGLICDLSSRNKTIIRPRFAIFSSGFRSGSLVHLSFYENEITTHSLHIFGETDEIITKEMSELLASTFENKQILIHPGGHYFPATVQQKQVYINFFQERLQEFLEEKEIEHSTEKNSFIINASDSE